MHHCQHPAQISFQTAAFTGLATCLPVQLVGVCCKNFCLDALLLTLPLD